MQTEIRMKLRFIRQLTTLLAVAGMFIAPILRAQPTTGTFGGFSNPSSRSSSRSTTAYPSATDIGQARITYDAETRSIIVVADEETAQHITNVVAQLDRPAPQVLIKCVFLEVTYNKGSDIGVSGSFTKNVWPSRLDSSSYNQTFQNLAGLASGAGTLTVIAKDFSATLRAIAEAGKLEVLSRPSVLARNNQQATITIGQQVPLITNVRYDTFGNQINGISYENVGIILQVTPFITSDGMVEMVVAPQISSLADSSVNISGSNPTNSTVAAVTAPIINIRSADTVVVTPDNQTVIIGGLISNRKSDSTSKIPLLGDIPILGAAFRRKVKNDEKVELLIFLTPTIVRDPRELAMMTDTEKSKAQNAPKAFPEEELNRFLDGIPTASDAPTTSSPSPQRTPK